MRGKRNIFVQWKEKIYVKEVVSFKRHKFWILNVVPQFDVLLKLQKIMNIARIGKLNKKLYK